MIGTVVALLLAAGAVLLIRRPSPVAARLRLLQPASDGSRPVRLRVPSMGIGVLPSAACGAAALAAWSRFGFGVTVPVLPALAGAVAAATGAAVVSRAAADRERQRAAAALVESVGALSADLRAGQPPAEALAALAGEPRSMPVISNPAVAAVWMVSETSGAPAAAVLDRVERDLRARQDQRREVTAQLAGARSTAVLLAGLPVLGIGLGAGMGAQPLRVLLGTVPGQFALLAGVGLEAVGVLWTARVVATAQGAS